MSEAVQRALSQEVFIPGWMNEDLDRIVQDRNMLAFAYFSMNPRYRKFHSRMIQACKIARVEHPGEFLGLRPKLYAFYRDTLKSYALEEFVDPNTLPTQINQDIWYRYLSWKSRMRRRVRVGPSRD